MEEIPAWLTHLFSFFMGLVVGSFLNVVIIRLPQKKSLSYPGSHCPTCGKPLRWYHNIPVLSFLALRGKCSQCHTRISIRYPIVEIMTGLLFWATELKWGFGYGLFIHDWPFVSLLVAITFIDLEHRLIPDKLSLPGIVLGLATAWIQPGYLSAFEGAALGFGIFYGLAWLYQRFAGRSGLGGGDIKLLALLGAFLGPSGVFATILISSILGSVIGISWGIYEKRKSRGAGSGASADLMAFAIPYGPFLILGGLYYYLLSDIFWLPTV